MTTEFEFQHTGGISYLANSAWNELGITHGFTGSACDFGRTALAASVEKLCQAFAIQSCAVPTQEHTNCVIHLRAEDLAGLKDGTRINPGVADALIAEAKSLPHPILLGVCTADCLPVILSTDSLRAVVHAGWRGLAGGILQTTLAKMEELAAGENIHVLIGPAAGPERYEVGGEVVKALKPYAKFTELPARSAEQKFLLDLAETGSQIIKQHTKLLGSLAVSRICTISDNRFHSCRRNGQTSTARNFSFVLA